MKEKRLTINTVNPSANRICIIGCGNVGTTCAYALLMNPFVRELVLVGRDFAAAEGEAMDLQHAVPLGSPIKVAAGTYKEAGQSAIVILAAGAAAKNADETRLELLDRNVKITRECISQLMAEKFKGVLLITTNPVDVLALVAQKESGLPASQVIGSGTVIDTARLRALLGEELGVEARGVHAFVIGEHGNSSVAVWSSASIAGILFGPFLVRNGCLLPMSYSRGYTKLGRKWWRARVIRALRLLPALPEFAKPLCETSIRFWRSRLSSMGTMGSLMCT